ncbi:ATP-binding protein [Thalassospira sp. ER-Se-21-Dark]|uniref:ATP-binding protein n=1 Tax=Thalassospira sp. ER-Se-21-Dark TaxID=2585190 RepID=UPI001B315F60|nr:ATP-binding protein [Thalassospira sp. ER-Se-21-Dark]MBP3124748.1 hypothetical protein [Thalassospira sp. ER-Se-21-Dark]
MASPISTGGGGIHFESRVAAYYFASLLYGGAVLGHLPGSSVSAVKCQRKSDKNPIDDVKVYCDLPNGSGRLDLQVKRTLNFGDNALFREVISDCWDTFSANRENSEIRFGAAIGTIEKNVEIDGRKVLSWARHSDSEQDFFERITTPNSASDGMRAFLECIRSVIETASEVRPTDNDLWCFLRRFVVLYFDFESGESSHSLVEISDRLRYCLSPDKAEQSPALWDALITLADEAKPTAGSHNRETLIQSLAGRFQLVGQGAIAADFKRVHDFSQRALGDIQLDILGSFVPRDDLHESVTEELAEHSVVEIVGEAGSGKSALARSYIESELPDSIVLALSSRRLPSNDPGWEGFARYLGVNSPITAIVAEISSAKVPVLLIDGAERIGAPGTWATINDILKAITDSPSAARWKVLITSRKNNLKHRQQINFQQLGMVLGRTEVENFSDSELDSLATHFPQLDPLLSKESRARTVAKRPYLLKRLAESGLSLGKGTVTVSEVDLMLDFWKMTSDDEGDPMAAMYTRQEALLLLGSRRLANLDGPISSLEVNPNALADLEKDDVIRHDPDLRQVLFAHDIIEDWTLCLTLQHDKREIPQTLIETGEPLRLLDAVQLLGQWKIERYSDHEEWGKLLNAVSSSELQPRWRRAVLSSPLLSTRAPSLLIKSKPILLDSSQVLLNELMSALRTIEVDPNPRYLNFPLLPGYSEADIIKVSQSHALPRIRSWQPFVNWYLPFLEDLPSSLVKETSLLLETIAIGYDKVPTWMAEKVAIWADKHLKNLSYGSNFDSGYSKVRTYLQDIGVGRDEKFRDRLLSILLRCADGAPEIVSDHLQWISEQDRGSGAEYIIENSNLIARAIPKETVDFLLSALISPPSDEDDVFGFGSLFTDFNELGIEEDRLFFSPSHLRPPFLVLLYNNETEGLRLIRGLCNAAMDKWLEILKTERSATPLPLVLEFEWGKQEFWGHFREYTWNRGMGPGPYTVMSALMALEMWMEHEIDNERDPNELFRKVLHENYCVGAVGACCAILLKSPEKCLKASLPFLTNAKLWDWDIHRCVQDGRNNSNIIGGFRDFAFRDAVAKRNASPHRQLEIRNLIPQILLQGTPELKAQLFEKVSSLQSEALDLEFEQDSENPEVVANAKERVDRMVAMCDPQNYQLTDNVDGESFTFEYIPPSSLAPDEEFLKRHKEFNEATSLAIWAEQSLEEGKVKDRWSLPDAIEVAQKYKLEIDFSSGLPPVEELAQRAKMGAVAGTAALILQNADYDTNEFEWAKSIILEASRTPLENDGITFPDSFVSFHPVVMAAYGFLSLVRRGNSTKEDRDILLCLSLHPLNAVKNIIFSNLKNIWEQEAEFCWEILVLGTRLCAIPESIFMTSSGSYGFQVSAERLEWTESELQKSITALDNGENGEMPRILKPWKSINSPMSDPTSQEFYARSEYRLLWDQLPTILFSQPIDLIFEEQEHRSQVVQLLNDLIGWTEMRIAPPWDNGHHGNTPYKWTNSFMQWCGVLLPHLNEHERQELVLSPVRRLLHRQEGEKLLDDLLLSYVRNHIAIDNVISSNVQTCWDELFDLVLSYPGIEWHKSRDFVSSGFGECVVISIFSFGQPLVPTPWENAEKFLEHIQRWVDNFGHTPAFFSFLVTFVLGPGKAFCSGPAPTWISNAVIRNHDNDEFWKNAANGESACDFFTMLINEYSLDVKKDRTLFDSLVRASDILLTKNVRAAANLQQRLSVLERNP